MDQNRGKPVLIAFWGFEGSGKNAAGDILVQKGFKQRSFAHNLKLAVCNIFGWEFEMIEGLTDESRKWREEADEYWSTELNMPGLTPRKVLQKIGTDVLREHFSDKIWVLSLKKRLMRDFSEEHNVVITDCRFPSEVVPIKEMGGIIVKIERTSTKPIWLSDFLLTCESINRDDYASNLDYCTACALLFYSHESLDNPKGYLNEKTEVHPAETSLIMYDGFDYTIKNDGTLIDLENSIMEIWSDLVEFLC